MQNGFDRKKMYVNSHFFISKNENQYNPIKFQNPLNSKWRKIQSWQAITPRKLLFFFQEIIFWRKKNIGSEYVSEHSRHTKGWKFVEAGEGKGVWAWYSALGAPSFCWHKLCCIASQRYAFYRSSHTRWFIHHCDHIS